MFFEFSQNNSGGYYEEDDIATLVVIIEADDHKEGNKIATDLGLFDYSWCECCGERFSSAWDDTDGTDTPTIYGEPIEEYSASPLFTPKSDTKKVYARVFYKNGVVAEYKR